MAKKSAILTDPETGVKRYVIDGDTVNKETFIATAIVQAVGNVIVIFALAKGLGISKRRAWALVAAANAFRSLPEIRVDVADATPEPSLRSVDADEIARRLNKHMPGRFN